MARPKRTLPKYTYQAFHDTFIGTQHWAHNKQLFITARANALKVYRVLRPKNNLNNIHDEWIII